MEVNSVIYLTEKDIQSFLKWETLVPEIENVMADVSSKNSDSSVIQPPRTIMPIPEKNGFLLSMPGMSKRKSALGCKLVTSFLDNNEKYNLPSIMGTILLFDSDTGKLKAIMEATTITEWRTAAASIVSTKYLYFNNHPDREPILSVFGSGKQARIHIIGLCKYFNFKEVRLWGRNHENVLTLSRELSNDFDIQVKCYKEISDCAKDADVIVTATYASQPILKLEDLTKRNVVINAIGAGATHHSELHGNIYEKAQIYTDSMVNANVELKGLVEAGFSIVGEIGEVISGVKEFKNNEIRIFHSLGMAVEDCVSAELIYNEYMKQKYGKSKS